MLRNLIVVEDTEDFPRRVAGAEVVPASAYLRDAAYREMRSARVYNLCRSYRYQKRGYYVSLLAAARGHKPVPSIRTILDMRSPPIVKTVSEDLEDLVQKSLKDLRSSEFTLSIYFGQNMAKRYERLARALAQHFDAPLIRAQFKRHGSHWELSSVTPISGRHVPPEHWDSVAAFAEARLAARRRPGKPTVNARYSLAILRDPTEELAPSDAGALKKFAKAAEKRGFEVDFLEKGDLAWLAEYDALFIRETTAVDHHTFRFAQKAQSLGIPVIDDPESIIRCTNKVYLAEMLQRIGVAAPRSEIVDAADPDAVIRAVGLPCVLKQPDSSFSQGVVRADDRETLEHELERMLKDSDMVLVQEYTPTDFDWRVGILEGQPLYLCKYYMAPRHWQVASRDESGKFREGRWETLPLNEAPKGLLATAIKAAGAIGNGLYGVDVKQVGKQFLVIEVNDNPSIETGVEDKVLGDALYDAVIDVFWRRLEARGSKL